MQPEDIDKLFRAKLEQHATPPPPSLWYDLQEQLEPEEKKRRGGFWMYAVAAAVALLLVAGGGWLFWQGQLDVPGAPGAGTLASTSTPAQSGQSMGSESAASPAETAPLSTPAAEFGRESATTNTAETAAVVAQAKTADAAPNNSAKSAAPQATVGSRPASTHQQQQLLARTERAAAPRTSARPEKPVFQPANEPSVADLRQAVAAQPAPQPAPAQTAALTPATPAGTPPAGAIEVEVRQHPEQVVALAAADADETPGRTRPSVRGVLRQMRRLAQGEKPNLAEVGLPANPALTVQARVAGHTLTKTISL